MLQIHLHMYSEMFRWTSPYLWAPSIRCDRFGRDFHRRVCLAKTNFFSPKTTEKLRCIGEIKNSCVFWSFSLNLIHMMIIYFCSCAMNRMPIGCSWSFFCLKFDNNNCYLVSVVFWNCTVQFPSQNWQHLWRLMNQHSGIYTTIAMNHVCFWDYDHDLYSLVTEWLF